MNPATPLASLRMLWLLAPVLLAALGCGKEVTNTIFQPPSGTSAADTIDANTSTNADTTTGLPVFSLGDDELLVPFAQQVLIDNNNPAAGTQPLGYLRRLDRDISALIPLGAHGDAQHAATYALARVSPDRERIAVVERLGDRWLVSGLNSLGTATTTPVELVRAGSVGPSSSAAVTLRDAFLSNAGLFTAIFHAVPYAAATDQDRSLYAVQVDLTGPRLVRAPFRISGAFLMPGDSLNDTSYAGGAMTIDGDLLLALRRTDVYAGPVARTTLHVASYEAQGDTWDTAAPRIDAMTMDTMGRPRSVGDVSVDTDGVRVAIAFTQPPSDSATFDAVYHIRLPATTSLSVPAAARIDTADGASRRYAAGLRARWLRAGIALVDWHQEETEGGDTVHVPMGSWSSGSAPPDAARTRRLLDLDPATDAGTQATGEMDLMTGADGRALLVFTARTGGSEPDTTLYVTRFTGVELSTADPANDNLAIEIAPAAASTTAFRFGHSGFADTSAPRGLVWWTATRTTGMGTRYTLSVRPVTLAGGVSGARADLERSRTEPLLDLYAASLANAPDLPGYQPRLEGQQPESALPPLGPAETWLSWRQRLPTDSEQPAVVQAFAWGHSPTLQMQPNAVVTPLAEDESADAIAGLSPRPDGRQADVLLRAAGRSVRYRLSGPLSESTGVRVTSTEDVTPPDAQLADVLRTVDLHGVRLTRSASDTASSSERVSTARDGSIAWTLYRGSDGVSQRLFAVRLR